MYKNLLKIFSFFVITLLIFGSIATTKTISEEDQRIDYKNMGTLCTDGKIQEIIDKINESLVRSFMEYLVFEIGSRYAGTYGCQKAAKYIYNQFENMGMQVRYQNWNAPGDIWHRGFFISQNVEATHLGTDPKYDEEIIFNAHYDSVRNTVGASDDGSGTVGVLAAAYVLSQYNFKRTIRFVTFSGEEEGLLGSHAYAKELYDKKTPVLVEFNADMIGRAVTAENGRKIRLSVTEDAGWIAGVMKNMTKEYGLNFNITAGWGINRDASRGGSDYFNFIRLGYESVCVWQAEGDPYMHTPQDNISNVNFSYLVNTTRHIAATIAILADKDVEVPQVYIANPRDGGISYKDNVLKNIKYKTPVVIDETNIYAEVKQGVYPIDRVEFYYDDKLIFTDKEKPFEYMLNNRSMGLHKIKVVAYDTNGNSAIDEMKILFLNIKTK